MLDPVREAEAWLQRQEEQLESRPVCSICGEHIQDESAVCIKGEWICDACLDYYREYID